MNADAAAAAADPAADESSAAVETSGDALWSAVTWHAFVDGLLSRSAGHDHNMGAYTVMAARALEEETLAFSPKRAAPHPGAGSTDAGSTDGGSDGGADTAGVA